MGVFNKFQEQVEEGCCRDTIKDQITENIDKDREKRLQLYADELIPFKCSYIINRRKFRVPWIGSVVGFQLLE